MHKHLGILLAPLLLLAPYSAALGQQPGGQAIPPLSGHAHNDYNHARPLLDALDRGFRSVEADVFARGDSLYVAHDAKDLATGRTLRSLYLDPLRAEVKKDPARFSSARPLILLVDIKDEGTETYQLLHHILGEYRDLTTAVYGKVVLPGPLMVIVSGNRPIEFMRDQDQRYAFVDGRLPDLGAGYSPLLMPLVSDRWTKHFAWKGKGDMKPKDRVKLEAAVKSAHENGQMIRFWATPDTAGPERDAVWATLLEAGVDLINTDDLDGFSEFNQTSSSRQ
ncbi:MAG: phosphatidylinositol-specific phospholipase C/glycerophosphodiester phosphodiesterase family protein [Bacteroidales bacterium]